MTFRPKSPNANSEPRQALPHIRPRCCLRYLTFFGINISSFQLPVSSSGHPHYECACRIHQYSSRNWRLEELVRLACLKSSGRGLRLAAFLGKDFAFVNPGLHTDESVGRVSFGKTVIDIGAQSVQRQATLQIPLGAGDFVTIQSARYANLDAFAAEAQCTVHALAHRAAEANALFQLQRNRLCYELSVEFRLVDFQNIHEHVAIGPLLQIGLELVDLGAFAANDDARTSRANDDPQLVARTFDFNRADTCRLELIFQLCLQLDVLDQELVIVAIHVPARLPRLGVAESESVRMDFLSHNCFVSLPTAYSGLSPGAAAELDPSRSSEPVLRRSGLPTSLPFSAPFSWQLSSWRRPSWPALMSSFRHRSRLRPCSSRPAQFRCAPCDAGSDTHGPSEPDECASYADLRSRWRS